MSEHLKKIEALSWPIGSPQTDDILEEIRYHAQKELETRAWWKEALRRLPEYLGVALATLILWWSMNDSISEEQVGVPEKAGVPADLPKWAEDEIVELRLATMKGTCYDSAYTHRLSFHDAFVDCGTGGW